MNNDLIAVAVGVVILWAVLMILSGYAGCEGR
jgi:hypothetical protein